MDEEQTLKEIEKGIFSDSSSKSDFPWKNLSIGIGVVLVVGGGIYFMVSSSIQADDYKSMDLSTKKKDEGVAGTSVQGPFGPPKNITPTPSTSSGPTATPTPEPTAVPTATPTSSPAATATLTPVPPTDTPASPSPSLTTSPTATPSGEPSD